jgi:hypothetical protein
MEDILYVGLALAFFAASIGLVHFFGRLSGPGGRK